MTNIDDIISNISHRPFALPVGQWSYYQEWNKVVFLHWTVPYDTLRKYVPKNLHIDRFENKCYISLVAFTMQKIRPRILPSISFISDFAEINLRTYINNNNKQGVYFLNIEAEKEISVFIAKLLSGLPYEKANINRTDRKFTSTNTKKKFHLDTEFEIHNEVENKTKLDKWLTERYCLYLNKDNKLYHYDIHHKEWKIKNIEIKKLNLDYKFGNINLTDKPNLIHYSEGVKVLAWGRQKV